MMNMHIYALINLFPAFFFTIPNIGIIMPNMGIINSVLLNALFSKVRQRVLVVCMVSPDRNFYTNEIIRLAQFWNWGNTKRIGSIK